MKNKESIYIIIIIILAALLVALGIYTFKNKKETTSPKNNMEEKTISELKESSLEMPEFTIVAKGLYERTITGADLKEMKLYDFQAGVTDGITNKTRNFTGVKLTEVLNYLQLTNYTSLDVKAPGQITVRYDKEEIDDKIFLVFYEDGKPLRQGEEVTLFASGYEWRYSVENVVRFDFL